MVSAKDLRALGEDGLAETLGRRPDVLVPVPPRSLAELAARLCHPFSLALALRPLNAATVQVAEALAALGPKAHRGRLDDLLGVQDDVERAAVDAALVTLSAQLLLQAPESPEDADPGRSSTSGGLDGPLRLLPQAAALWRHPLGLGGSLHELLPNSTCAALQSALRALGERAPTRKAEAMERVAAVLGDRERVRRLVGSAPAEVGEHLRRAALGHTSVLHSYQGFWTPNTRTDPLGWAVDRMLLFRNGWYGELTMPAEVALALRGPQWRAPFDPLPPPVAWTHTAQELVERESAAAAAHALRTVAAVLQQVGATPMPLLKSGAVGVRELRRIAKLVGCEPAEVRFTLALALWVEMVGLEEERITPTVGFDAWQAADPARRLAALVGAWIDLPECPMAEPGSAWRPETDPTVTMLRLHLMAEMSRNPGGAPTSLEALAQWALWQVPIWDETFFDGSLEASGDLDPLDDPYDDDLFDDRLFSDAQDAAEPVGGAGKQILLQMRDTLRSVLAEAAWLGLTGAGALSASGAAVIAGEDVASIAEAGLGAVQQTARLQADLTAVVLGHPSPRLAEVLDQFGDRESRSTAATWRFSPASVRRAMDAGLDETTMQQMLATVAEGDVPQPLSYLVSDVARRHGRLRAGELSSYVRCDDDVLLTELVADRSLRKLELRRIAPGVIGAAASLASVLGTLRAAGYLPVAEDATGAVMLERQEAKRVRSVPDVPPMLDTRPPEWMPDHLAESAETPEEDGALDLRQVAINLLAGPDHPAPEHPELGSNVIDMAVFEELLRRRGDDRP